MSSITKEDMAEIATIVKLTDMVAMRHFPDCFAENYPYVDRNGRPVAIIDTEQRASSKYRVYGKAGSLGTLTGDRARQVYAKPIELLLDVFACSAEELAVAMLDAALGAKCIRRDAYGNEIEVYDRAPDPKAVDMILNRLMGKPAEERTITATVDQTNHNKVTIYVPENGRRTDTVTGKPEQKALPSPDGSNKPSSEMEFVIHPGEYEPRKEAANTEFYDAFGIP